ncbi:hypothetical protein AKJ16_DCAP11579 [Drosera capensis]
MVGTKGTLKRTSASPNNKEQYAFSRNLQQLDLSANGFEGSLSSALGGLRNLKIPTSYRFGNLSNNLTKLVYLDMSRNDLNGSIPQELFSPLRSLVGLLLDGLKKEGREEELGKLIKRKEQRQKPRDRKLKKLKRKRHGQELREEAIPGTHVASPVNGTRSVEAAGVNSLTPSDT